MAPAGMMVVVRKLGGHGAKGAGLQAGCCYNITLPGVHGSIASKGVDRWGLKGTRRVAASPIRRSESIAV